MTTSSDRHLPSFPQYLLKKNALNIYLFHGVVKEIPEGVENYIRKHVEEDYFHNFLKESKTLGKALSIDEAVYHIQNKEPLPPYAFVVTFDDGFENNYSVAAPVLSDLGIQAVFYITSNWVDTNAMAWVDKAELALRSCADASISLDFLDREYVVTNTAEKIEFMTVLRRKVKSTPEIEYESLVAEIYKQCGLHMLHSSDEPLYKKLSWKQVSEIASDSLFTIGGHTHTHPIMSYIDTASCDEEIRKCLDLIQYHTGTRSVHFAYPDGQLQHYNKTVIELLKKRGIICCPSAQPGYNHLGADLFNLCRNMIT